MMYKDKYEWDDIVTPDIKAIWYKFLTDLPDLNSLLLNRYVLVEIKNNIETVDLHGFSDSSKLA